MAVDLLAGLKVAGEGYVVQDSCHAKEKGRVVRAMLPGSDEKSASHCRGAGTGLVTHDRLLAEAKAKKTLEGNTKKIVTYCPFCYQSLAAVRKGEIVDIYALLAG